MNEQHPISEFCKAAGITQAALASKVGCKRWMINRIVKRERTPSPQLAARIQEETGIDARKLLGIPAEMGQ